MKQFFTTFLVMLFLTPSFFAQAQLTKAEKKEIKKTLKGFKKDPESYQSMIDKYEGTIKDQSDEIERLKGELDDCNAKLAERDATIESLKKKIADLEAKVAELQKFDPTKLPAGKTYLVQVGNYKTFDISKEFNGAKWLMTEETADGKKYIVSYFNTEEEAESFAKDLRKLGIRDTWVAYYEDGKRMADQTRNDKKKTTTTEAPKTGH